MGLTIRHSPEVLAFTDAVAKTPRIAARQSSSSSLDSVSSLMSEDDIPKSTPRPLADSSKQNHNSSANIYELKVSDQYSPGRLLSRIM